MDQTQSLWGRSGPEREREQKPELVPEGDRCRRLLGLHHTPAAVAERSREVYTTLLARSPNIRAGNFTSIATSDLRLLFELDDAAFFDGLLAAMLRADGAALTFRLSRRMTQRGGTTTRLGIAGPAASGQTGLARYEIAVSTVLLFGTFHDVDRPVTVGGLLCRDRLEALLRIFEHELLHLAEFLAWGDSSCNRANFHRLSQQIFGHAGVEHDLVTPREQAAARYDVRVGDLVSFEHEGGRHTGRVNRITKRATVLVEDPGGLAYSDGKHYATFYVPVAWLRREETL